MWKKASSVIITYDDKKMYGYNTLNGKLVSISIDSKDKLIEILDEPDHFINDPIFNKLKDMSFIINDSIDVYQLVEEKFNSRYIKDSYLGLTIMPTELCNFRCVYCYEEHIKPEMPRKVQEALIKYVEKNINKFKGLWVEWFGGEPLLAINTIEYLSSNFIRICKMHKKPYRAGMTTNGYLLDYKLFTKLYDLKVQHFQVTIDGDKDTHNIQRPLLGGGKTYDKIISNLKEISHSSNCYLWGITIRTNISINMMNNISNHINMLKSEFYDDKRFTFVFRKMWSNSTIEADNILCDDSIYDQILNESYNDGFISKNDYKMSFDLGYVCYASKPYNYVVGSDGKLYKCTVHLNEDINHIGHITENGFMELDKAKIAWWNIPNRDNVNKCKTCSIYATCAARSCPMKRKNENCSLLIADTENSVKIFKHSAFEYYEF